MIQGKSLHIGLNQIDKASYGTDGQLVACENDALSMQKIADAMGYTSTVLLTKDATSARVIQEIGKVAKSLQGGDMFFLTYSGHGGQVPDTNGDEDDGFDETWCLFDRMVVDDELYQLWSQFRNNVRILVLSDSCHSGTVLKVVLAPTHAPATVAMVSTKALQPKEVFVSVQDNYAALYGDGASMQGVRGVTMQHPRYRALTPDQCIEAYTRKRDIYDTVQWMAPRGKNVSVGASLLLISGCQDSQLSSDGDTNGLFTEKLLEVWDDGNFSGDYRKLHTEICRRMPPSQVPNYDTEGYPDPGFESQRPFVIATASQLPSGPSVKGPAVWAVTNNPPTFSVTTGENTYYIFEITARPELFSYDQHGSERTEDNFYGSYSDSPRYTSPCYTLPDTVWKKLAAGCDKLYYRIGTTSSKDNAEGWANYQVSTLDDEGDKAPFLTVV